MDLMTQQQPRKLPTNGMAISAVVLGATAIPTAMIPILNFFAILLGLFGALLGFAALRQLKMYPNEMKGRGLAIAGIVTNLLGTLLAIGMIYWISTLDI